MQGGEPYRNFVIPVPYTTDEIQQWVDDEDAAYELTGTYRDFVTPNDARTFIEGLEYYLSEGYSAEVAEELTKQNMGL